MERGSWECGGRGPAGGVDGRRTVTARSGAVEELAEYQEAGDDLPPLGCHALVFAGGWSEEECRRTVGLSHELGYDIVEVPLLNPGTVDAAMTKAVFEEYGVAPTTSLGLSEGADVNSEDRETVANGEALLDRALAVTHQIGAEYMVGVIYSALKKYPGPCSPAARRNVVRAMRNLADKAADRNVTLGLEVVNRYETNVANTAGEGLALLAEIDRPNVALHLDTYHMNIEESSLSNAIRLAGDKLGYVHIGESHRGYLGSGNVDFKEVFRALVAAGYAGPMTFESFSSEVVSPDLSNALCVWRNLWSDSVDLAGAANNYMAQEWTAASKLV